MKDIEEMIADAKAEEEVEEEFTPPFKSERERIADELKKKLSEYYEKLINTSDKINVSIVEYVELKQKEIDLDRLCMALCNSVELNYSKEYLTLENDSVLNTFKALYPDTYYALLADVKEREGK